MTSVTIQRHPAIDQLTATWSAMPRVRRILLFGSRARGTARPLSDIDLAVEAPGADAREWSAVLAAAEDAGTLLKIDVIRLDEASADFRDEILREGVTLYERRAVAAQPS